MKRLLLAAAAVMTSAIFTTISAEAAKPIGGWSDIEYAGGTVTYDSTDNATNDTGFKVELTRPKGDGSSWPTAVVTGAITETNFEGLTNVVVNYTVNKITEGSSGVAVILSAVSGTGEFEIDREEPTTKKWYGSFQAVLTTGMEKVGEAQSDTLSPSAFYLAYAGGGMADADVIEALGYNKNASEDICYLHENLQVLEFTSGVAFSIEHDITKSEDTLDITVQSVEFIMGTNSIKVFSNGTSAKSVVTGMTKQSLNVAVPAAGSYKVSIFTANGRLVEQKTVSLEASAKSIPVSTSSKGVYLVQVEGAGLNVTEKVTLK